MTTAGAIITRAFRESNLVAVGATATTAEVAEALGLLNSVLLATMGSEAGQEITDLAIGGPYDQAAWVSEYVPEDVRLTLDLDASRTLLLHPLPYDGQRLAVADAGNNLATYNVTLDGNGRRIESATTVVLATDGLARQWFYRADLGEWKRVDGLVEADEFPFPAEFDDYFAILLAMRLNPRHGRELAQSSAVWLERQANKLEARYRRPRPTQDWGTLGLINQRGLAYGGSGAAFSRGRSWI